MTAWKRMLAHLAWLGLVISSFQVTVLPLAGQEITGASHGQPVLTSAGQLRDSRSSDTPREQAALSELPDSPGAIRFAPQDQSQQKNTSPPPATAQPPAPPQPAGAQTSEPAPAQTQQSQPSQPQSRTSSPPQKPVGTAAAETSNASGVAASQPAGVAIAPAKQHRVRTIVLRTGAIIGAGVAVGTIAALSLGTPSKPPGAH